MEKWNTAEYRRMYYRKRQAELITMLGGRCVNCGSTENLEIDHIDPSTKEFTVSDMLLHTSKKHLVEEIKKCQLLCSDCHKEKTKKDLSVIFSGEKNPFYGKRGEDCIFSKPVVDLDTGEEYCSATAYAEKFGLHKCSVERACRGERKSIAGHHVRYKSLV